MKTPAHPPAKGTTLLEICLAAGILGVLMVLLVAGSGRFRDKGQEIRCVQQIRQVGSALLIHAHDHGGRFPLSREDSESSGTRIWAGRLYHEGYLTSLEVFYCLLHSQKHRPEQRLLKKNPGTAWANISYGASKFSLMPKSDMLPRHQTVHLSALREPGKVLMLAEARVLGQNRGGWYQFWADFEAAADPQNEETIVYGRHQGRAALMYCDGRVEVAHVRNDLYKRTNRAAAAPWFRNVYTSP